MHFFVYFEGTGAEAPPRSYVRIMQPILHNFLSYRRTLPWLFKAAHKTTRQSQFPRSYVRKMLNILQRRSEDMCFFRHAPSLKGWVSLRKKVEVVAKYSRHFFNAYASITRLNTPIICEHNRHISPYNKKRLLFFEEIRREYLRMCIFCCTFAV